MDWLRIYNRIIAKAKLEGRKKGGDIYYEAHHIIPVCMGGKGDCRQWKTHKNIVLLTAREHYVCHLLLCMVFPHDKKLAHASWLMIIMDKRGIDRNIYSSKIYADARQAHAKTVSKNSQKAVLQYSLTGDFIQEWSSTVSAARAYDIGINTISPCCRGEEKSVNGYVWRYKNPIEWFPPNYSDNRNNKEACVKIVEKNSIPILQYDFNGDFIQEWSSAVVAGATLNINASGIRGCCNGRKLSCGKFVWRNKDVTSPIQIQKIDKITNVRCYYTGLNLVEYHKNKS